MQSSVHREKASSIAMILETRRNVEFPHRNVDKRPRKRPRLAWDAPPPPLPPPSSVFHPPLYYGPEFASGVVPSFGYPNMFYNGLPRQGSPPWRPDDKDGHFSFVVGDTLTPRYQILSKMGEGTFGQVLECFDNKHKEAVAIKVIRSVPKYREAAMIEIDVLQRLSRHDVGGSRCVQIRNWFDYRNHICIVFEKLGPSLYDFLRKNSYRSFPIDLVRELGRQLLESVAYMHDLRLIHTDLKPENILLVSSEYIKIPDYKFLSRPTRDGSYFKNLPKSSAIKLIDFGSTTLEHQDHNHIVSTRHYRAPEVILGVGWNYPCDLWSIGCILVELCSGEALFQTHENLEHLAMMERVLGPLPPHMVLRADRRSDRYFRRGAKLDWPEGATSRDSLKAVWKLPRLPNLIMQHVDHSAGDLIDLLLGLLRYDPTERLKAREALNHPFFTRSREQRTRFISIMESLGRLQPFHLSFPKHPSFPPFRPLIRPNSSFKHTPIKASSSKSQNPITPLHKSTPFRLFKSTCITLTTAAALLFVNLQLKPPAIAAPVAPPPSTESKEHMTLEEEERALEEHLATHPPDVDSLRSLMEVKIRSRKLTEAVEVVDRLIKLEPEEPEWPVLKANIFTYSGEIDSATASFEEILAKDPLRVEAYHGLVMAYSDAGLDLKEVESRIQEAMLRCKKENNHNDFRDFKLLLAQIRVIEGKHSEALKLYRELVKEEPGDFRPYLCQGVIYTLLKKKDKAEEQFDKFRELVPENHPYREYFMDNLIASKLFSEKTQREMAGSES
ncbi:hypothetical protein IGI04_027430 [Brassica rapa subsp. trilocularis]|uniref:Protein kinase domain-containing protein n=1 Tax=Brassica rapa subsp. trilocularis TaxID=1813537 RepID=A0ABQ7L2N8_BRACM|nr:hypothetical protein IGI04_027430 [Brassica rapa subsp. trilocularis]